MFTISFLPLQLTAQTVSSTRTAVQNLPGNHDNRQIHERFYVICPLVGAGTLADPKRPQVVPKDVEKLNGKKAPSGIIAWTFQVSDDGKSALVELVARDASAFDEIKRGNPQITQNFSKSTHSKSEVEAAFKAQRKDFDFKKFGAVVR